MINRSTLKYSLKKILPNALFSCILFLWRTVFLHVVEKTDLIRLKKFTQEQVILLQHQDVSFLLLASPKNGFIDKHIFLYGVYEPFMLDLIRQILKKGMTFIDIGANIGQHSIYAARIVGEQGNVHSFEPIPHLAKQIEKSVALNRLSSIVTIHNYALGEKKTEEELYVSKNIGGSSLVNDDDTLEKITVHVKAGDNELAHLETIHLIKIDVEGYEYEVLRGIEKTLTNHKPDILIEFSGAFYESQKNNHGPLLLTLLRKHGYTLYDIEDSMTVVKDDTLFYNSLVTKRNQTNLLCKVH
jgi:FkbM family methyltransferase